MKEFQQNLDGIIDESLRTPPDFDISASFTDDLVKRLERQLAWRELLGEFGIKLSLILGALMVVLICLIFPAKNDPTPWIAWLAQNRMTVSGILCIILFTFVFDQVLLKYLFGKSAKPQKG